MRIEFGYRDSKAVEPSLTCSAHGTLSEGQPFCCEPCKRLWRVLLSSCLKLHGINGQVINVTSNRRYFEEAA